MMNDEREITETSLAEGVNGPNLFDASKAPEGQSFARIAYRQLVRNRLAMFGFALVVIVVTVAVFVPFLANDKPYVIHTVLVDDYDEAFFSWLDAHEEIVSQATQGSGNTEAYFRNTKTLLSNLKRMRSQLDEKQQAELEGFAEAYRAFFAEAEKGGYRREVMLSLGAKMKNLQPQIEAKFDLANVTLVPRYYFPILRTLRPLEVFFLVLYFGAAVQWLLRRRSPPTWKRARRAFVLAVAAAVAWGIWVPKRTYPVGYFKGIAPKASMAVFPPVAYGETEAILEDQKQPPTWLIPPWDRGADYHVLGTDLIGRDVLSRMIYGARIAMMIGVVAVSIYVTIGIIIGACAGFFRGKVDILVSRIIEIVLCFPFLFLVLIVLAYFRPSIINVMVVLGLIGWTGTARLTRGEFLRIVNLDYVNAIQALGGSSLRVIFRHILPNGIGPVLVVASFGIAAAILVESALSFLGMGVPQPFASWGTLLNEGHKDPQGAWWLTIFPGLAIFITVTAWNLFGEGLRDAIDPRLKQ